MTQGRFHAFALSLAPARHRGAATVAAVALAAALAAAGCGGGGRLSKAQYEKRIQKDSDEIRQAFEPLAAPTRSLKQLAANLKTGEQKLRAVADDLDAAKPPKDVAHDNDLLVAGLRRLATNLEPLRRAAEKNNVAMAQRAQQALRQSHALVDARRATDDMRKKGYKLGPIGG